MDKKKIIFWIGLNALGALLYGATVYFGSFYTGGILFCALLNLILFIIYRQNNLIQLKVNEQTQNLNDQQAKFLSLLNSVTEGIYGLDTKGKVTFANEAANKMLGYQDNELLIKSINPLSDEKNKISEKNNAIMTRQDGSHFWSEYSSTPLIVESKIVGSVVVFNDITQRRKAELQLEKLAHFDTLTGLPNRASLLQTIPRMLEHAKKNHSMLAICFIDIDNFKQINDNFGHHTGDALLCKVGKLIQSKLHENDYIARLGGDEFGLIITDFQSQEELEHLLKLIVTSINRPMKVNKVQMTKSISIGSAIFPFSGKNTEELLRLADIAMYRAKEAGKNNYQIYNQIIHKSVQRKYFLDRQMSKAIKNNEFYLLYQPQINIETNKIIGIEALVYWNSSELGGRIFPSEFIPVAEDNGLIFPIGEWVLKQACYDFNEFINRCKLENVTLSVNISIKQLNDDKFFDFVNNTLEVSQLKKSNLMLEIAESALIVNIKKTLLFMEKFKNSGIQFALDNFGTGHFSMDVLRSLPISLLKIDRTFVQEILKDKKEEVIIQTSIQLAQALGIKVIAEGVETEQQLNILKSLGCDLVQGFYFAKPMMIHQLIQFGSRIVQES